MKSVAALTTIITLAAGHGIVTSPPARQVGDAFKAACGEQPFNNQKGDPYGNQQQLEQNASSQKDFNATSCQFFMCKGYQLADNTANVQSFTAGQTVQMKVDIRAPHTGDCNVSVIDLGTNTVIGTPMIEFQNYASTSTGVAKNNTDFEITMPDVAAQCGQAGQCAVQWWWDSREADQTYMSCIDFTMA